MKLRALIGKYPEDEGCVVAGCVDNLIWEVEGQEDTDARWDRCKREFGPAEDYIWREVVIEISDNQILAYFQTPTVRGEVAE